jgi:hypothetical protein
MKSRENADLLGKHVDIAGHSGSVKDDYSEVDK